MVYCLVFVIVCGVLLQVGCGVCVSCVMGCDVCKLFELCSQGVGLSELCRLRQDFTYDMYLCRPHLQT